MINFFEKIKMVLSEPKHFFTAVKKEKSIWKVFEFYFIFVFISVLINTLFLLPSITSGFVYITKLKYFLFILTLILFVLIVSFLTAFSSIILYWLYHILIKIFNGKERYNQTYKLLYAATPMLIVLLIPMMDSIKNVFSVLFVFAAIYTVYLEYIGLQKLQKMSKPNIIAVLVISFALGLLLIHFLIKSKVIIL